MLSDVHLAVDSGGRLHICAARVVLFQLYIAYSRGSDIGDVATRILGVVPSTIVSCYHVRFIKYNGVCRNMHSTRANRFLYLDGWMYTHGVMK